jgi:transcriptional regulator with XRE-family HTH domain
MPESNTENYGQWLRKARNAKGWKQAELAEKSGISGQQISNIETGRSPNPQAATRAKLEKALDDVAPEAVVTETQNEQSVENLGALQDFDPYAKADLPKCTGVYVFYDITDRPVYVGRATERDISQRVPEHYEKFWFKPPVVDRGAYIQIDDGELCKKVEQVLIRFLKSNALFNKQGVDRE